MVWEHKHIANEKLEAKFEGEAVTLRKLLKLDILPGVPKTWPGDNYDYFWIVDFAAELQRAVEIHHGEAGVRRALRQCAVQRLGHAERARCFERLQGQGRQLIARSLGDAYPEFVLLAAHPCGAGPLSGDGAPARRA